MVVNDVQEMDQRMGDAIADQIEQTRKAGKKLAHHPAGRADGHVQDGRRRGIKASGTQCDHVTTFNMDEWSDAKGNTMPGNQPGGFEYAMGEALFGPLGKLTVPPKQRNFATKKNLPTYAQKIAELKSQAGQARDGLRHRPGVPHRVLGAAPRRRSS